MFGNVSGREDHGIRGPHIVIDHHASPHRQLRRFCQPDVRLYPGSGEAEVGSKDSTILELDLLYPTRPQDASWRGTAQDVDAARSQELLQDDPGSLVEVPVEWPGPSVKDRHIDSQLANAVCCLQTQEPSSDHHGGSAAPPAKVVPDLNPIVNRSQGKTAWESEPVDGWHEGAGPRRQQEAVELDRLAGVCRNCTPRSVDPCCGHATEIAHLLL
jgi:hypothetical protein